jgi:hypothetical protein
MRILLASDKFKGALPSPEVAAALRLGLAEVFPGAEFDTCHIAADSTDPTGQRTECPGSIRHPDSKDVGGLHDGNATNR